MYAYAVQRRNLDITKVQEEYLVLLRNSFTLQRDVFYVTCLLYFMFHDFISHTYFLINLTYMHWHYSIF